MIVNKPLIGGLTSLRSFNPLPNILQNFILLQIKVPSHDALKPLRRVFNIINHRKFHVRVLHNVLIRLVLLLPLFSRRLVLETGLVEVNGVAHDNGLNRDQNLHQRGKLRVPIFSRVAPPGSEKRQADLSARVQIRVEPHLAPACGLQVDLWRAVRVAVLEEYVENVGPVGVGGADGTHYHRFHHVDAVFVASAEYSVCVLVWEGLRQIRGFAGETDHFRDGRRVVCLDVTEVMVGVGVLCVFHVHVVEAQIFQQKLVGLGHRHFEDLFY